MTVKELIEKLQAFPENEQNLDVLYWTGEEIIRVKVETDDDGDYVELS